MNILAVGAHPDDVEANCGGTLAKYAAQGARIVIATATSGNIGSAHHSMEEIARIRKSESAAAAGMIGAEYICLDYDDEMFFEDRKTRLRFIDLVRYARADVILTHNTIDYNPDHVLTGKIISDIPVMIPIAHLKTPNPPHDTIPAVYYFDTAAGVDFQPTEYVDITDVFDLKMRMLRCHQSQIRWMADNYKDVDRTYAGDYFESYEVMSRFRGIQAGVRYAEGFRRLQAGFMMSSERHLP